MSAAQGVAAVVAVNNVHYVDTINGNFLFRGGIPLMGDPPYEFNIDGLRLALQNAADASGIPLPTNYRIIDISLIQVENADEIPKIQAEYEYFTNNAALGEFHHWDTNGTGQCALASAYNNIDFRNFMAMNLDDWMGDTLVHRTETLRAFLENASDPTVIYVHCEGGEDRTGEMIGAYYMRFMGYSWEDMNLTNSKYASAGYFGCNNYRATLWYCIYLVEKLGYALDYSQAFDCNDGGTPRKACTPDS